MVKKSDKSSKGPTFQIAGRNVTLPDDWIEQLQENDKKRLKDIQSRSKQLFELLITEEFTVENVIVSSHSTYFTPKSEIVIGGSSSSYSGGFTANTILQVTPSNPNIPVRQLNFSGYSALRGGDYIKAVIPSYDAQEISLLFQDSRGYSGEGSKTFYFDRLLKKEESIIELILLNNQRKPIRTERSIDYDRFKKE
ncbi:hypothetical protein J4437_00380 [Candidatus Woesearchaeota archaeon]|nr:hypothetical protein [Candidatus Woesearchaeota archaeon]